MIPALRMLVINSMTQVDLYSALSGDCSTAACLQPMLLDQIRKTHNACRLAADALLEMADRLPKDDHDNDPTKKPKSDKRLTSKTS